MRQEGNAVADLSGPAVVDGVSDADLVHRARAGDETAFALLIEPRITPLLRFARGLPCSPER